MVEPVPRRIEYRSAKGGLSPRLCALFDGVCAHCPNNPNVVEELRNGPMGYQLPPFADSAIEALARCRNLTAREREVLTLCCSGQKNSQIASVLGISLSAVRRHVCNLHKKTNTSDKAELILNLWHSTVMCPDAQESQMSASSG